MILGLPRLALRLVFWAGVCVLSLWASVRYHADMPLLRHALRDGLQRGVSALIRGELTVGAVDDADPDHLILRDVQLWSARGRRIVRVDRLELSLDMAAAGGLRLRFDRALLTGGHVTLRDAPDGNPNLLWALQPADQAEDSDDPLPPFVQRLLDRIDLDSRVLVDGVELHDFTLSGRVAGLDGVHARDLHVRASMRFADDVDVEISDASALLVRPFPFAAHIDRLHGGFSSNPAHVIELDARLRRGDAEQAHVGVWLGKPPAQVQDDEAPLHLRVDVDASPLSTATLDQLGYAWAAPLQSKVVGSLGLSGPLDNLALSARLLTDGGPVEVHGDIADNLVEVRASTEGLALPGILPDAPALTVAGEASLLIDGDSPPQLHARLQPTVMDRFPIPGFALDGELPAEGGLRITAIRATQRGAVVRGSGDVEADGAVRLRLTARIPDIGADPSLRRLVPNARGAANADLRMHLPADPARGLSVQGKLELRDLRYGALSATRVDIEGRASGEVNRPVVDLRATASGLGTETRRLGDAALSVRGGPGAYKLSGTLNDGSERALRLDGTVRADRGGVQLDTQSLHIETGAGTWRGEIRGLSWRSGTLGLERLMLLSRSQRLEASAAISPGPGEDRVSASMSNFDLSVLRVLFGDGFPVAAGHASTSLEVAGNLTHPSFVASGLLSHGEVLGAKDVTANYFVSYEGGQLDVDTEVTFGEDGQLLLRGSAGADEGAATIQDALDTANYDLQLSFERLRLQRLPALAAQGIAGAASGTLRARGSRRQPKVDGELQLAGVQLPDADALDVAGSVHYADARLETRLEVSDARGPVGSFELGMHLPWLSPDDGATGPVDPLAGPWTLRGTTAAREPALLPAPMAFALPTPTTFASRFVIERDHGTTRGSANLHFAASQDASGSPCRSEVRPELTVAATISGAKAEFDTTLEAGGATLVTGAGSIYLPFDEWLDERKATPPSHLTVLADIKVPDFEALPYLCAEGRGSLEGKVWLRDLLSPEPSALAELHSSFSPRAVTRNAAGRRDIRSCDEHPVQLDVQASADRKRATLEGSMAGCGGGSTRFKGKLPTRWGMGEPMPVVAEDGELLTELTFKGAQLRPFLGRAPGIESGEGVADGKLLVQGPLRALRYDGNLAVRDGRLLVSATGQQLEQVRAEVHFTRDRAQLVRLHAGTERGSFDMSGFWTFERSVPRHAKLVMELDELPVRSDGITMAWLTGAAAVEADIGPERSQTAVKIHRLLARLPGDVGGNIQPLSPHPDIEIASDDGVELRARPYVMEFQVDARAGVDVTRPDMSMRLVSELGVTYSDAEMRVAGYTEIERGDFIALGKPFEVSQGSLRFLGGRTLNPELQVQASHAVAATGDAVVMSIQGRLAAPIIRFSSETCPGEAGAMSLLLSGKCPDAGDPEAAGGKGAAAFGGGLLGGLMSSSFGPAGPRLGVQSAGDSTTTVRAGFETEPPAFMRRFVNKIYVEGGIPVSSGDNTQADQAQQSSRTSLDILLELYFPNHIVGAGRVGPDTWGLDVTWEP